jgi:hypothetical protein
MIVAVGCEGEGGKVEFLGSVEMIDGDLREQDVRSTLIHDFSSSLWKRD